MLTGLELGSTFDKYNVLRNWASCLVFAPFMEHQGSVSPNHLHQFNSTSCLPCLNFIALCKRSSKMILTSLLTLRINKSKPCVKAWMNPFQTMNNSMTQQTSTSQTEYHVIEHIIVLVLVLITVLYRNLVCLFSRNSSNVTPVQAQQDIGSNSTTGQKPLMVVPQKQSSSTKSTKPMVDQRKEAGGTRSAKLLEPTVSSLRSNASTDCLTSHKTLNSMSNHLLMTVVVSPPFMPPSVEDMQNTIPLSGLTIARH